MELEVSGMGCNTTLSRAYVILDNNVVDCLSGINHHFLSSEDQAQRGVLTKFACMLDMILRSDDCMQDFLRPFGTLSHEPAIAKLNTNTRRACVA